MSDKLYIGADLGTSSLKLLLVDTEGKILREASREYPLLIPREGWSEQEPWQWWTAFHSGMGELLSGIDGEKVAGIGVGGQMHGLVALDSEDRVIRPAILWNDGRTYEEVEFLNSVIGKEELSSLTANIAFAGFTAPKLLWMQRHEPENFARISKIMLPKDYINYMLTGNHCCDYSDASGMLLLDVEHKCWSERMLGICGIREDQMPQLYESYETVGYVKEELCSLLGLSNNVAVVAGAGDNAAAAIGTGTVNDGSCNISLGTSGTIFISSDKFASDPNNALHSFAHANGRYHLMGCMLSAASCNKWFCENILDEKNLTKAQSEIIESREGENPVFFLPYLMGERSPINDTDARAAFVGMSMDTSREDMLLAVYEGVAFALRDSFEVAKSIGLNIEKSAVCGGGAKSERWVRILANVLGIPLERLQSEQGPGYGAAILAMVGCGEYLDANLAAEALVHVDSTIYPDPEKAEKYQRRYEIFKKIYPGLKETFSALAAERNK